MVRLENLNDENKELMKKIVNEKDNNLLDDYIEHFNSMIERNEEGLDKSILVYEDEELVLYLNFAIVNKAMFLNNMYHVKEVKNAQEIKEFLINEYGDYSLINLDIY